MVIEIRATAEGVKQGVSVAQKEFKKLEEDKKRLEQDLKIKIESSELLKLQKELADLQVKKKDLEAAIKFNVESAGVQNLKKDLESVLEDKKMVEEDLKMHMSMPDMMAAQTELERLNTEKLRLEEAIKVEIKTDAADAKKQLNDVNLEIADMDKKIAVEMETSGINKASQDLQVVDAELKNVEKSSQSAAVEMAAIGAVAAKVFTSILDSVKTGTEAYNQSVAAMSGLASQMDYIGTSMGAALDIVKDKTSDGLISETDVAMSIKNLTTYGFTIEQTSELLDRLKDSAAYNRQAHYSLGESIRVTTEGIKNENSVLADAAGVTKNISKMYDEYAKSLEVTTNSLTQSQKAQAVYNGVLAETEGVIGNAAKYSEELAGVQAEQEAQTLKLAQAYGEAMAPAVQAASISFTNLLKTATEFINENQTLVQGVTVGIAVYTSLVAVLGAVKAAKGAAAIATKALAVAEVEAGVATTGFGMALNTLALNPYILGLTAAATAIVTIIAEIKRQTEEQAALNAKIEEYSALKNEEITLENLSSKQNAITEIQDLIVQYADLIENISRYEEKLNTLDAATIRNASGFGLLNDSLGGSLSAWQELIVAAEEYGFEIDNSATLTENAAAAQEYLKEEMKNGKAEIVEYNKNLEQTAPLLDLSAEGLKKMLKPLNDLEAAHKALAKGEELNSENLLNLIDLYPSVAKHIADNVNWRETLIGVIEDEAAKSKAATVAELQNKRSELEAEKARLLGMKESKKQEAVANNAALADMKAGYDDLVSFIAKAVAAIESKGLVGAALDAVGTAASDAISAAVAAIDVEIAAIDAKIKAVESYTTGGAAGGRGGGGAAKAQKEENEALKEALRLLEERKKLTDVSIQEEIEALTEIRAAYAKTEEERISIDIDLRDLRRQANEEWYQDEMAAIEKMNRARADKTDYQAVINRLQEALETAKELYGGFSKEYLKIEEEITSAMVENAEKRADKLLGIATKNVDDRIDQQKRELEKMQLLAGTVFADETGVEIEFKFGSEDKIEYYDEIIRLNNEFIAELQSRTEDLTQAEYDELQNRLAQNKNYYETIEDLHITAIKEQQALEKKATEDRIKDQTAAAKKINKEYIDELKSRYTEELRIAQENADAEIKIYADQIAEIDELLKSEARAETDAQFADRMRRLQEQLTYEVEPTNIYELNKQIALEQSEFEKRKRRESLEDEKASLQAQISAVRESLSTRKQELQDLRDEEIRLSQESLEDYITDLQAKSEKLGIKEKSDTKTIDDELKIRDTNNKKFLSDKYKAQEQNSRDERGLMSRTTDNIITDLYNRIWDYAEAGRQAGQAWANAFAMAAQEAAYAISDISSGGYGYSSVALSPVAASYDVSIQNTFQVPVPTPSSVAAETRYSLEQALRQA